MSLLTKTFHLARLKVAAQTICRSLSTNVIKPVVTPALVINNTTVSHNPWIYKQPEAIRHPNTNITPINLPNGIIWLPFDDRVPAAIEAPTTDNSVQEKQAARLIVIRRKKMKKHKLRKLRKRMKFERAKIRQRRELKKEKDFQAVLIKQCKEAEAFSAERFVEERLNRLHEVLSINAEKGSEYRSR